MSDIYLRRYRLACPDYCNHILDFADRTKDALRSHDFEVDRAYDVNRDRVVCVEIVGDYHRVDDLKSKLEELGWTFREEIA